jgi:hypothetical protein
LVHHGFSLAQIWISGQTLAPEIDVDSEIPADFGPENSQGFWKGGQETKIRELREFTRIDFYLILICVRSRIFRIYI